MAKANRAAGCISRCFFVLYGKTSVNRRAYVIQNRIRKEYAQKYARLWQTMRPETDIEKAMLEVYSPGDMQSPDYECGIWVTICKPEKDEYEAAEISSMMITGIL